MSTSIGHSPLTRGVLLHINATTPTHSKSQFPFLLSLSIASAPPLRAVGRRAAASMSYDKQLAAAKKAASLAARLCQKVQKALLQSDVQTKSDRTPVTVADYGAQAVVSFILEKQFPSVPFSLVAEEDSGDLRKEESRETLHRITELVNETLASDETSDISPLSEEDVLITIDKGKSEGGPHGQHWVLDPIDGTKGFLRGDQYAIALALLDKGKVVLGVLACPNLPLTSIVRYDPSISDDKVGCLFLAQVNAGTYMQSLDGSLATKVHVSAIENPEEASFFESFEAAHSSHDLSSSIAKKLGVKAPPARIDSQAKYGALSRGDGAIYLRFPRKGYREKIWDHAAGCIVVAEAGGIVTDAGGNPLDFSKGRYLDLDTGIVVTNQKLMPKLLKAVQDSIKEK
ncbi:Salt-sensitive 3'-phosphoadenosine-5'-phosphatase HAL2/SAL1 [Handroanthus impetiginosus]|uniref:3'(2'),5'-bisphosphate nucleotidase n=1 Tax=Handroanthus impetiginosus TaxID=429701 RepID=A0A2G9HU18_9LAMI|nr:Salt-sensitive 3'-phosphoadenosine-5'-phosphatase HAL2/SAL1 [Handroanthus impetiginosus]